MDRRTERGAMTREQLVAVATRLFTENGYEGTAVEAVLRESGVSRGALYHHFGGKDALFEAALDAVYERVMGGMAEATAGAAGPGEALRAGCLAWIRLAGERSVQRILLIDAPTVLGWQRWRAMDERRALHGVKLALTAAAGEGLLPAAHVDLFAHALLASLNEIAIMIARSEHPEATLADAEPAVGELLDRLLSPR